MFFSMICRLGAKYMNLISGKLILHILYPNIHNDSAQSAVFQSDIEASCSIELNFVVLGVRSALEASESGNASRADLTPIFLMGILSKLRLYKMPETSNHKFIISILEKSCIDFFRANIFSLFEADSF